MLEVQAQKVSLLESAVWRSKQVMADFIAAAIGKSHTPWQKETPTTTMYFADVMADLIRNKQSSNLPIVRLEANVFQTVGENPVLVIIRYASPEILVLLKTRSFKKVIYVFDDDISSIELEKKLPSDYRRRLENIRNKVVVPVSSIATEIVAPSAHILEKFRNSRKSILLPSLVHKTSNLAHYDDSEGQFNIVFSGTRSHLADLKMIIPALQSVLARNPQARLTTFLGNYAPIRLSGRQVEHLPSMDWHSYREFIATQNFHLALAPALNTPFNRARSSSRIMDNAGFGAVGIYSNREPFANWIEDGVNGLLVGDDTDQWINTIQGLINSKQQAKKIAEAGIQTALNLGNRLQVREFWMHRLNLC